MQSVGTPFAFLLHHVSENQKGSKVKTPCDSDCVKTSESGNENKWICSEHSLTPSSSSNGEKNKRTKKHASRP